MHVSVGAFGLLALVSSVNYASANDACVDLAKTIGMNYQRNLDVDQMRAVRKADLCSSDWNTSSSDTRVQLQASYKLFSGSGSASAEQVQAEQHKECSGQFGEFWRKQVTSEEALNFSQEAASVITACLSLASNGLAPKVLTANVNKITFSAQYLPSFVAPLKIKQFGPSNLEEITCTITKDDTVVKVKDVTDTRQTIQPSDSVSLECLRNIKKKEIQGVAYECVDEDIFTIATSGTVQSIKIPMECAQEVGPSRADQLEAKVTQLTALMNAELGKLGATLNDKASTADLEARFNHVGKLLESKANAEGVQVMTNGLGSCMAVLNKPLAGTPFWPLVMVPCNKDGPYQVWKIAQ